MSLDIQASLAEHISMLMKKRLKGWQVYPILCRDMIAPGYNYNGYHGVYGFSGNRGGMIFLPPPKHVSPIAHYHQQLDEFYRSPISETEEAKAERLEMLRKHDIVICCRCKGHTPKIVGITIKGSVNGKLTIFGLSKFGNREKDILYGLHLTKYSSRNGALIREPKQHEICWALIPILLLTKLTGVRKMRTVVMSFNIAEQSTIDKAAAVCVEMLLLTLDTKARIFIGNYEKSTIRLLRVPEEIAYHTVAMGDRE